MNWDLVIVAVLYLGLAVGYYRWSLRDERLLPVDWFDEITAWREEFAGRDHWDVWEQEMAE